MKLKTARRFIHRNFVAITKKPRYEFSPSFVKRYNRAAKVFSGSTRPADKEFVRAHINLMRI